MSAETNYIYIIQVREFVRLGEQTYKIGKTGVNPPWKRFDGYPKDSQVKFLLEVPDRHTFERKVLDVFKSKYRQMLDYGNEYFMGNLDEMIQDMISIKTNRTITETKTPEPVVPTPRPSPEPTNMDDLKNAIDEIFDEGVDFDNSQVEFYKNKFKDRSARDLRTKVSMLQRKISKSKDNAYEALEITPTLMTQKEAISQILLSRP
jgi:hypothetical protein